MTVPIFVYWNDYNEKEEETLNRAGMITARLTKDAEPAPANGGPAFLRAHRLSDEEFAIAATVCRAAGYRLITSPQSFGIANDFALHYRLLRGMSPKATTTPATASDSEVLRHLRKSGLRYPIFVRSDRESAAKYVGVDGCVLRDGREESLRKVLDNLRKHVKDFRTIIYKELVPLKKSESGKELEYRAIGAAGALVTFDYPEGETALPSPESLSLDAFAARALKALAAGGADGALFIDVALSEAGEPIVVECKDFSNGTIKNLARLAAALKEWRAPRHWPKRARNLGCALAGVAVGAEILRRAFRK